MALQEYYGETCPHCITMKPIVEKLEKELGLKVEKYEVWNSEENTEKMLKVDKGLCGGVPFFYNTENKQFLCGGVDEDTLKLWMTGKLEDSD